MSSCCRQRWRQQLRVSQRNLQMSNAKRNFFAQVIFRYDQSEIQTQCHYARLHVRVNLAGAQTQRHILQQKRTWVDIKWQKVESIHEWRVIMRCYSCQKYGHTACTITVRHPICGFCARWQPQNNASSSARILNVPTAVCHTHWRTLNSRTAKALEHVVILHFLDPVTGSFLPAMDFFLFFQ